MAKKTPKKDTGDEEEAATTASGAKGKLLAGVAAVALVSGGYVFTSGGGSADAAPGEPVEEPVPVAGEVVALEPITLNLADGRFLKVGLALQLVEGAAPPQGDAIAGYAAPALDEAISYLGGRSYADLVAPGGRDAARTALSERVGARYDGEVLGIYFTELVMQ